MCRTVYSGLNKKIIQAGLCKQVVQGIYIAAMRMMENSEYLTAY